MTISGPNLCNVKLHEVQNWNKILIGIRSQAKLAGQCFAPNELYEIGLTIYFVSSGLYIISVVLGQEKYADCRFLVCLCVAMSIMHIFRSILKLLHAVRITSEVSKTKIIYCRAIL